MIVGDRKVIWWGQFWSENWFREVDSGYIELGIWMIKVVLYWRCGQNDELESMWVEQSWS